MARSRILYVEGYFVTHSLAVALDAVRRAHSFETNAVRLLSLSASYVCRQFLSHLTYVFFSPCFSTHMDETSSYPGGLGNVHRLY